MHIMRNLLLAAAIAATPAMAGAYTLEPTATAPTNASGQAPIKPTAQANASVNQEPGGAAPVDGAGRVVTDSIGILIRLFVLAVILESALTVVFHWRPYLSRFNGKAVNPLVTFAAALTLVLTFHLDQVGLLIGRYSTASGGLAPAAADDLRSAILTALVIAGGSAGVNKMLQALGYRSNPVVEEQRKPARTEAWIAVVDTSGMRHSAYVVIRKDAAEWAVLGMIQGSSRPPMLQWMLRDRRRFPTSAGYPVPIETPLEIGLMDTSRGSVPVPIWGPIALAAGAIIDVSTTIEGQA